MKLHRLKSALVIVAAVATLSLSGCASAPVPSDYVNQTPVLDLKTYFNGNITAYGVFTDRGGKVARRFTVDMNCTWVGNDGVLDENFTYSDGSKERRVWRIKRGADGKYTGTADDVVGVALGQASGNALQWSYTLRLPVDGSVYEVQFDDWMYLMSERVLLNKAVMSKFGVRLGEVTLSFYKN
jgi:Protein of unknown function (DUF3833)